MNINTQLSHSVNFSYPLTFSFSHHLLAFKHFCFLAVKVPALQSYKTMAKHIKIK